MNNLKLKSFFVYMSILVFFIFSSVFSEINVYFGNLHAHSNLSDGNKSTTPDKAFEIAKNEGDLDFLCLSEHNHMLNISEMNELLDAVTLATESSFVALYGQEFSTINKGFNHTNIQNYPTHIPDFINGQYDKLFIEILPEYLLNKPNSRYS